MVGSKSIIRKISIPNLSEPSKPFAIRVQANKNYGICDIILGTIIKQKVRDRKTGKDKFVPKFFFIRRLLELLNEFQGRQYNDPSVMIHLENVAFETLNPVKK